MSQLKELKGSLLEPEDEEWTFPRPTNRWGTSAREMREQVAQFKESLLRVTSSQDKIVYSQRQP